MTDTEPTSELTPERLRELREEMSRPQGSNQIWVFDLSEARTLVAAAEELLVLRAESEDDPLAREVLEELSDEQVEAELRSIGLDPAEVGRQGVAFTKLIASNLTLRERVREYEQVEAELRAVLDREG